MATTKATQEKVFVATMESESFTFTAVGRTEAQARRAIARKFHELATEHMTLKELDEWYGIEIHELAFGECDRL